MNKVSIYVILVLLLLAGAFYAGVSYEEGVNAKEKVKLSIERDNALAKFKEDNDKLQAELNGLRLPSTEPIEKVITKIKIVYRDKPLYIYREGKCSPSDDFIRAYSDTIKSTKD